MQQIWAGDKWIPEQGLLTTHCKTPHTSAPQDHLRARRQLQKPPMMQLCLRKRVCFIIIQAADDRDRVTQPHTAPGAGACRAPARLAYSDVTISSTQKINTVKGKPQEKVKLNITSGFANTFLCLFIKSYPVVTTMPGRWGCWVCLHFPDTKLRMKSHSESHTTLSWFSWELN